MWLYLPMRKFSDAAGGPPAPGMPGVITEDEGSDKTFLVRSRGREWWYEQDAIKLKVPVVVEVRCPSGQRHCQGLYVRVFEHVKVNGHPTWRHKGNTMHLKRACTQVVDRR